MTQAQTYRTPRSKPKSNLYTVLAFVAFVCLGVAVAVVWIENLELTGMEDNPGQNPFYMVKHDSQASQRHTEAMRPGN